jgi:hypothetical protein
VSDTVRVYVNARAVDVAASGTALDAIEKLDPAQATAIRNGERLITDSRGIVIDNATPLHNGAIFRIVRSRQAAGDDPDFNSL